MKPNELRIGIWVHNNVENLKIKKEDLIFLLSGDNEHMAEPIPLTEEWLEKFGFEEKEMTGLYAIYGGHLESSLLLSIRISKTGYVVRHPFIRGIKILHVHQLQNLYFALTGEELKLTEQ